MTKRTTRKRCFSELYFEGLSTNLKSNYPKKAKVIDEAIEESEEKNGKQILKQCCKVLDKIKASSIQTDQLLKKLEEDSWLLKQDMEFIAEYYRTK